MVTVTRSNGRLRYILQVFTRSGISAVQGAHQVAQKFTSTVLSVAFRRSALRPSTPIFSSVTGSLAKLVRSEFADDLPTHLIEHPTAGVFATSTTLPARTASIALRASATFAYASRG